MTTSQVPIIAWQKRYMASQECSRSQSMGALRNLPDSKGRAYRAFGNAVNAEVVLNIFDVLAKDPIPMTETLINSVANWRPSNA